MMIMSFCVIYVIFCSISMYLLFSRIYFIALLLLCCIESAEARWATIDDAPAELNLYNYDITVGKDGSVKKSEEAKIKVLNESGREMYGTISTYYNGGSSVYKVVRAKSIVDGKEYKVRKSNMENKAVIAQDSGFDQTNRHMVAFDNVVVGAELYLKSKMSTKSDSTIKHFAQRIYIGDILYTTHSKITIKSAIPLRYIVNDPLGVLSVTEKYKGRIFEMTIELNKPIYQRVIEDDGNYLDNNMLTYVDISSYTSYSEMGNLLKDAYNDVMDQPLPPLLEEIYEKHKSIQNDDDKISSVISDVIKSIRYMGDWRTIRGGIFPRSMEWVASTAMADCKEFSVVTAAILRKMGYDADVAIVWRGANYIPPSNSLPSLAEFNHAIVLVRLKNGKKLWLDPTNHKVMVKYVFADIENRPALVLYKDGAANDYIPAIKARDHRSDRYSEMFIGKEGEEEDVVSVTKRLSLRNRAASSFTGAANYYSLEYIKNQIALMMNDGYPTMDYDIDLPDLASNITSDLDFKIKYKTANNMYVTNYGIGFPGDSLHFDHIKSLAYANSGTVANIIVAQHPFTVKRTKILKDCKADNLAVMNYQLNTPWFTGYRKAYPRGDDVYIEEYMEVFRKHIVRPQDLNSDYYQNMIKELKKSANVIAVINPK